MPFLVADQATGAQHRCCRNTQGKRRRIIGLQQLSKQGRNGAVGSRSEFLRFCARCDSRLSIVANILYNDAEALQHNRMLTDPCLSWTRQDRFLNPDTHLGRPILDSVLTQAPRGTVPHLGPPKSISFEFHVLRFFEPWK